ncbi:hypothetical protein [Rhodococcus koreensis]
MPNIEPPAAGLLRLAHKTVLTAGTVVWRVHSSHRAPNPTAQPDELAGGRFDSLGPQLRLPLSRRQPRYIIYGPSQKGYGRQTRYDSLPLSLA